LIKISTLQIFQKKFRKIWYGTDRFNFSGKLQTLEVTMLFNIKQCCNVFSQMPKERAWESIPEQSCEYQTSLATCSTEPPSLSDYFSQRKEKRLINFDLGLTKQKIKSRHRRTVAYSGWKPATNKKQKMMLEDKFRNVMESLEKDCTSEDVVVDCTADVAAVVEDCTAVATATEDCSAVTAVIYDCSAVTAVIYDCSAVTAVIEDCTAAVAVIEDCCTEVAAALEVCSAAAITEECTTSAVVIEDPDMTLDVSLGQIS